MELQVGIRLMQLRFGIATMTLSKTVWKPIKNGTGGRQPPWQTPHALSKHQFYDVGKGECDSCPEGMVGDVENTRECIKPSIFGMESTTTAGIELIVGVVGGVVGVCGCLGTAIACLYI